MNKTVEGETPNQPQLENRFYGQDFITVKELDRQKIEYLFAETDMMRAMLEAREVKKFLLDHAVTILFFEPSSRTCSSFIAAAQYLGAVTTVFQDMNSYSSVVKNESFPDTIKTFENTTFASTIVIRHPDDNSSKEAAKYAEVPIVNAGSGSAEHPTQALLDLYTIYNRLGRYDNLNVVFIGDARFGRTIKSLADLLAKIGTGNQLTFVTDPLLALPDDYKSELSKIATVNETQDLQGTLAEADVVYVTRTQKERFEKAGLLDRYPEVRAKYKIGKEEAALMKPEAIIMHPLPRQEELRYGVDKDPRAAYFDQMGFGLPIRMALLKSIIIE